MRYRNPLRLAATIIACLGIFAGSACGGSDDERETTTTVTPATQVPSPTSAESASGSPTATAPIALTREASPVATEATGLPGPVQAAIQVAADEAGVAADDVELLGYEDVEWNNSALGCPQTGGFYAQAIIPGYIVRVEVNGETIEYHTDNDRGVVRCDRTP